MRCPQCGGKVRFCSAGMGNSDAPGYYFYSGLTFVVVAAALVVAGLWSRWCFIWAGFSGLSGVGLLLWAKVAVTEGFGNRCENCGQQFPSAPWSL